MTAELGSSLNVPCGPMGTAWPLHGGLLHSGEGRGPLVGAAGSIASRLTVAFSACRTLGGGGRSPLHSPDADPGAWDSRSVKRSGPTGVRTLSVTPQIRRDYEDMITVFLSHVQSELRSRWGHWCSVARVPPQHLSRVVVPLLGFMVWKVGSQWV